MQKIRSTLLTAVIGIACSNVAAFADTPDQEALEAEQKYRMAERIYQKRLEEKEQERVVKQREKKYEQRKHSEEEETEQPKKAE